MSRLKCVRFDLDDTLVPEMGPEREALVVACGLAAEKYGVNTKAMANTVGEAASELWGRWGKADLYSSIAYSGWEGLWGPPDLPDDGLGNDPETVAHYKRDAWDAVLSRHGISDADLRNAIIERHRRERIKRVKPYAGVKTLLTKVSTEYPLGIVTNGSPAVQRFKLERAGLAGYFSTVVASGDVGVGKPDPRPFMTALGAVGVHPGEAVMIGNSWRGDVQGANNLGMASIWFNQDSLQSGEGPPPTKEISSLDQVPEILETLGGIADIDVGAE